MTEKTETTEESLPPEICVVCGEEAHEDYRFVLVRWRRQEVYCSERCLKKNVLRRRRARRAAQLRWSLRLAVPLVLVVVATTLWKRHRAPQRHAISYAWPEALPVWDPPPMPPVFGPPWPPTDEQWTAVFDAQRWTYPLPGPVRRAQAADGRIFGPEPPRERPALCREEGHCGIDLGGELWGEHVYAAMDGIVERVYGDERRGGHAVRLSHLGGQVSTQYFHLAATPRYIGRGAHVKAGEVIGLLGDTGLDGARRHLHFALSVRPSSELSEVYWDPTPWLGAAPLRLPPHGTVAGFAPTADRHGDRL